MRFSVAATSPQICSPIPPICTSAAVTVITRQNPGVPNRATHRRDAYPDLHDHIAALEKAGQLIRVDRPINKDTEMHPLVRWQFRGGIAEKDRKAFLFTNVVDSKGKHYDIPVIVGGLAANREIYRIGLGCEFDEIEGKWARASSSPITPKLVIQCAVPGDRDPGRRTEPAGPRAWTAFRCRFRLPAGTMLRTRRFRSISRRIPRPACRTWAITAVR